jgi:hypothetical protein
MIKMLAFVLTFLPAVMGHQPMPAAATCACANVSNVQVTGQGSGTISFSWSSDSAATQYKLWYVRLSDGYTSGATFVTGTVHTYTGLAAGQYSFKFVKVCGGEGSNIIGLEEIVQ